MKTTTIHVRIPGSLKKAAQKIAKANGLDLSTCIRVFLTHMDAKGTIPLPHLTVNGFTEGEEVEILHRAGEKSVAVDDLDAFFKKLR